MPYLSFRWFRTTWIILEHKRKEMTRCNQGPQNTKGDWDIYGIFKVRICCEKCFRALQGLLPLFEVVDGVFRNIFSEPRQNCASAKTTNPFHFEKYLAHGPEQTFWIYRTKANKAFDDCAQPVFIPIHCQGIFLTRCELENPAYLFLCKMCLLTH